MTASPWSFASDSARIGTAGTLALVDGATFVVSSVNGDIHPDQPHGLFVRDTRVLSRLVVEVDNQPLTVVSSVPRGPFSMSIVTRAHHSQHPHHVDPPVTVLRHRTVAGPWLREVLELRNHSIHAVGVRLTVSIDADFASLFDVKADIQDPDVSADVQIRSDRLQLVSNRGPEIGTDLDTEVVFETQPDACTGHRATWDLELGPGAEETLSFHVRAMDNGVSDPPASLGDGYRSEQVLRVSRGQSFRARFLSTDPRLERAAAQSLEDLAVLRIFDPAHADRVVVAAGAPWFMALFGRDSILTAWMALIADHQLAAGVLLALAEAQGTAEVEATEEQPGRILHEVRYDHRSRGLLGGSNVYYGTVDATPLFVMLVAEYLRWTDDWALVERLLPAVDRALQWIEHYGDRDGDGFVEYERKQNTGLANQGWKDSWDGVRYGDGRVAEAPIALCEVQAYVYGAYRAMAYLADVGGLDDSADHWQHRAAELKRAFDAAFWVQDIGTYAIGLDGDKRPIDSVSSNVGHCLWAGIVPDHRAGQVAEILTSPAMSSGWGLRTLSADNPAFNPLSYHCGSVWPHDTAIAVAGLQRYGLEAQATSLRSSLLDAAAALGGRLPELFAGFGRSELPVPVAYPASCSPQAWAAASTLLLIRSMVGLDPDLPRHRVELEAGLASGSPDLQAEGVPLGAGRVRIVGDHATILIDGLGTGIDVEQG